MLIYRLLPLMIALFLVSSVQAQTQAPPPTQTTTLAQSLDADTSLPDRLLLTTPFLYYPVPVTTPTKQKPTLLALAETYHQKVVKVGSVTVLAPREMTIINTNPGKPQLFSSLKNHERLKLLFASFTEAQWQQAGSMAGLGIGDLTDEQRPLMESFLAPVVHVQQSDVVAGDQPDSITYANTKTVERPGTDLRMHLSRSLTYQLESSKGSVGGSIGSLTAAIGKKIILINELGREPESEKGSAYGQPILKVVPAATKPSEINFDAPALNQMIPLDGVKSVGNLVVRIAEATHQPITVDSRIADLPLYARGSEARAGDLLLALADMVCGAYRLVGDPNGDHVYYLTDAIEGIGTRLFHLSKWGEDAFQLRYTKLEKAVDEASAKKPLSALTFDSGDPLAAPPQMIAEIEKAWSKEKYATPPTFAMGDLPAPIRDGLATHITWWRKNRYNPNTDRVQLSMQLKLSWVIPGIGISEDAYDAQGLGMQFLQSLAPINTKSVTKPEITKPKTPPHPFPDALHRRVLIVAPKTAEEAVQIVRASKRHGFSDVWIQVPCNPQSVPLLTKAVQAGKAARIAVGAIVPLLQGIPGEPERNIGLEEESARVGRLREQYGTSDYAKFMASKKLGWIVADARRINEGVSAIAGVPALSALVLRATAAPGYIGESRGGDGLRSGEELGYTATNRIAFIRKRGLDPVDIARYDYSLSIDPSLPLFPYRLETEKAWFDLRLEQNHALLRDIHAAIRAHAPALPIFMTDRANDFTDPHISWYCLWEDPSRLPHNEIFGEDKAIYTAAQSASKTVFLNVTHWWDMNKPDAPADFGRFANEVSETAIQHWKGLVLDLTAHPTAEALRLIGGIPIPSAPKESEP